MVISTSVASALTPMQSAFSNLDRFISSYVEGRENEPDASDSGKVILGNERLLTEYSHLIKGKRLGLVTNQT